MKYMLLTMYVSGGLIPSYLLMRTLHLINTFWVYVIPVMFSAWNMVIFKSFFENLPEGLLESAKIDGAGEYMTFFKIVIPISGPVFASLILFTAVDQWNGWFEGAIYVTDQKLIPLQTLLKQIISANTAGQLKNQVTGTAAEKLAEETYTSKSLSTAAMFVTTIPIIMVYPFLQKYFVGGMMVGSIKE
ncbi:MAG: carbohydrate ABC transporter permease [Clostridiales bacterium]|nr:carbohydrate ABC transporter permease [Clostridiales bacterium]